MANKKQQHKNCIRIFKRLSEYLEDELDDQTCREIGGHLQECIRLPGLSGNTETAHRTSEEYPNRNHSGKDRKGITLDRPSKGWVRRLSFLERKPAWQRNLAYISQPPLTSKPAPVI